MGGTEHRRSSGELRKAVTWCGRVVDHAIEPHRGRLRAKANAPHGPVFALSLPADS